MARKRDWWQNAVFYQIYPRSFFDSNNDGEGDIPGITAKLDYIKSLGVDAIWSCPYFVSPKADNGYDVADYRDIDPSFGTLDDWKIMIKEIHKRGMKFLMDLVVNHSSDEHEWFKSARSSKDSPYRDYYIFREGKDGKEPSNWASIFGGSAWEYNEPTDDYYLHLFAVKQPDLNWENPKVMDEISDIIDYWADLGVDGFRLDAFNNSDKDQAFPDVETAPGEKYGYAGKYYVSRPGVDRYIHELYKRELGPRDLVTVAELAYCPDEKIIQYSAPENEEFDMLYFFDMLNFDQDGYDKFSPTGFKVSDLKKTMDHWIKALHGTGYCALFLGNHDQCRPVSRFGNTGEYRIRSAKTLANAMYFLEGIPYIYQGEELGMTNTDFSSIDEFNDVEVFNYWNEHVKEKGEDPKKILDLLNMRSRDTSRSPMPWNAGLNAGFSESEPWLKIGSEYKTVNVEVQDKDSDSVLNFYRELIKVRHARPSVINGDLIWIDMDSDDHMSYIRKNGSETLVCLNNFRDKCVAVSLPSDIAERKGTVLLSNLERKIVSDKDIELQPWECLTYLIED